MLDDDTNDRAVMGDNNPPAFDLEKHGTQAAAVEKFLAATQVWLNTPEIRTKDEAEKITDQINGLQKLTKSVEEERKEQKKPHDVAGQAVQDAYLPLVNKLKAASNKLKPKLQAFKTKLAEAERQRKAEEAAEARRALEEAQAAAKMAEMDNDVGAQIDAEEALKAAKKTKKEAARPARVQIGSASGVGKAVSERTVKTAVIENPLQVFMALRDDPTVLDALQRAANTTVRAKGYDHDNTPLPGIRLEITKTM